MTEALVKRGDTPPQALQKLLAAHQDQIVAALPKHLRPERLVRLAVTALHQTPQLQNCTMVSIANSVMLAAQLGLEPNNGLGHGWLIPYKNVCTFQPGYRGLIELAYRSGTVKDVSAQMVYENEHFIYEEGTAVRLEHRPLPPSKRGEWIGVYSRLVLDDGTTSFHFMWREEIEAVRDKASKAKEYGPWVTWFEEMCKKTVLKRHLKTRRLTPEILSAVGIDDQAEAFGAQEQQPKKPRELAQDLAMSEEFQQQAEFATDELKGSMELQEETALKRIEEQKELTKITDDDLPDFGLAPEEELISAAQAKRLFAIAKDVGWTTPDGELDKKAVKKVLQSHGYDSTKEIKKKDYDAIISTIEGGTGE